MTDQMLSVSTGNKYHEGGNPALSNFITSIQGSMGQSIEKRQGMKFNSQRIFDKMKGVREGYIETLVEAEKNGHVKGLAKRLVQKYKQVAEFQIIDPKKRAE